MKAQHETLGLAVRHPVIVDALRQRGDVAGVVVIAVDEAPFGQRALAPAPLSHLVEHGGRRRGAVLRIQRQHQDMLDARRLQLVERRVDRRIAVAHRHLHDHAVAALAEIAEQELGLLCRPHGKRRALGHPDAGVLRRRLGRAHPQHDAVQDRPPHQLRDLDDPRVAEELGQIAAQRLRGRRIGRAQVAEQDRGGRRVGTGHSAIREAAAIIGQAARLQAPAPAPRGCGPGRA